MKPPSFTKARNAFWFVKLYSRPSCSPGRGERVVSRHFVRRRIGVEARKRARTGDGEAKGVWVICKETLEYRRFT